MFYLQHSAILSHLLKSKESFRQLFFFFLHFHMEQRTRCDMEKEASYVPGYDIRTLSWCGAVVDII